MKTKIEGIDAYPLYWPTGWPRTPREQRRSSAFKISAFGRIRDEVLEELRRFKADPAVISSNIPLRLDGLPYANTRAPEDPGVAVYFNRYGEWDPVARRYAVQRQVIACDRYRTVGENLRAVWATLEALRRIERHGASELLDRAFEGFKALPAPAPEEPWWVVLGVDRATPLEAVRTAYRRLAHAAHPDKGGSEAAMQRLTAAWAAFERETGR